VSHEEYAKLVALQGKARKSATLTDAHGGEWVAMSVGAEGVLMEPKSESPMPDAHPLHGIGPLLLKIVTNVERVRRVAKVAKANKVSTGDDFSDEEPLEETKAKGESPLFPKTGSVEAEFAMMSLPELSALVPTTYGPVVVGGTAVGYSIARFETSLSEHISSHGMDEGMEVSVYRVIEGVCAVVSCFDTKPENFVVSGSDVRMIDFGQDFCDSSSGKTAEHAAADVAMCTLLFCLSACKDERLLPLPFLTGKLLDKAHEPLPSAVAAIDALSTFYPDEGTIYTRAIENVQMGQCFSDEVGKRRASQYTAGELLTMLSQFRKKAAKTKDAGQAGFGRERRERREPKCAIL
jgi:hypothetical protein